MFIKNSLRWLFLAGVYVVIPARSIGAGLTVNGATMTLVGPMTLSTEDDITLSGGSIDAGSAAIQVTGDWTHVGGTFIPGTSTVTFQGAASSTSTLTGSTTFYSLQCVIPGKALILPAGSTQTIAGTFTVTGAAAQPIRVYSSIPGTYAYLINSGTNTVVYSDSRDIHAGGGVPILSNFGSIDSGNNVNWFIRASASSNTFTVDPGSPNVLTFNPTTGPITLVIPAGTFGQSVTVTLQTPSLIPSDPVASPSGHLTGSGVAVDITVNPSLVPAKNVNLTISYRTSDVIGFDTSRLVLARYDTTQGAWLSYASTVDSNNRTVTAPVNHFSIYQIMQITPSNTVASVKIFPNPMRPSLGHAAINFANLPAFARIRIYTLRGELVQDLSATAVGIASWDGKTKSGQDAASGVYLVLVQGEGQTKTVKLAIER